MAIYEYPVKIRLDRARTARAFNPEESLWIPELQRIAGLLKEQLAALGERSSGKRLEDLPLLAMAIFGTYGSGKTSLLMTLRGRVNQNGDGTIRQEPIPEELSQAFGSIRRQVYSLPVIKPNLASRNDNFLYAFLATALAEVDRRQEKSMPTDSREHRQASALLSPVHQAFHEVSEYLQVIDESESGKEYDPLGVSLERLERHASDIHLKDKLGALIDRLATFFTGQGNNSLLLLPIDDADLAANTLVNVLNTYRRYLEHPRLVPVFAFTGRMAEDLMVAHFAKELKVHDGEGPRTRNSAEPGYSFEEQIALQYLSKLFPVRNRIRLGPAPARVQAATFESSSGHRGQYRVLDLLETASALLFGHAEWPIAPSVRLALRPSSLRRQIQVLDAMYAANVDYHMEASAPETPAGEQSPADGSDSEAGGTEWVAIFGKAGWSLLNAHRDALREYGFYLDDLYGWTPRGLREVVLSTLLGLDLDVRRKLLRRWHYRTEDRRSQILSLLALIVFRPRLEQEEASGDDPDHIRVALDRRRDGPSMPTPKKSRSQPPAQGFPVEKGFLWFLNLWLGFYLPQILARNRADRHDRRRPDIDRVRGVGWNLLGGPVQAIREALNNREIFSPGMLFVEPEPLAKILVPDDLSKIKTDQGSPDTFRPKVSLLVRLWCYYGYEQGKPWAAVSFWRGLSLIGLLLSDDDLITRCRELKTEKTEKDGQRQNEKGGDGFSEEEKTIVLRRVRKHIDKHLVAARVPGSMLGLTSRTLDQRLALAFAKWADDDREEASGEAENGVPDQRSPDHKLRDLEREAIGELADRLLDWLGTERDPILPMPVPSSAAGNRGETDAAIDSDRTTPWRDCFSRRLHGEDLLGTFWRDLGARYFQKPTSKEEETAATVLGKWTHELLDYWSCARGVGGDPRAKPAIIELLEDCPILEPFTPAPWQKAEFLGKSFKNPLELTADAPGLNAIQPVASKNSPFAEPSPVGLPASHPETQEVPNSGSRDSESEARDDQDQAGQDSQKKKGSPEKSS